MWVKAEHLFYYSFNCTLTLKVSLCLLSLLWPKFQSESFKYRLRNISMIDGEPIAQKLIGMYQVWLSRQYKSGMRKFSHECNSPF